MRIEQMTIAELKDAQVEQAGRVAERKQGEAEAIENLRVMERQHERLRLASVDDQVAIGEANPFSDVEDLALIHSRQTARATLITKAKSEIEILQKRVLEASRRHERELTTYGNILAELHHREREIARADEALELQRLRELARANVAARAEMAAQAS